MVKLRKRQIVNLFNGVRMFKTFLGHIICLSIVLMSLGLSGCEDTLNQRGSESMYIQMDTNLEQDSNGFYHLTLNRSKFQTLHRLSGKVEDKYGNGLDVVPFDWESNLFWVLNDTLGKIIRRNFNDEGLYVSVDTSYIIGFDGQVVPTINPFCYSNSKGEFNQMTGFVKSMVGDTAVINISYFSDIVSTLQIVLD